MREIFYTKCVGESLLKELQQRHHIFDSVPIAAHTTGKTCASRTFILDSLGSRFEEQPLTLNDLIPLDKNGKPFEKSKSKFHK